VLDGHRTNPSIVTVFNILKLSHSSLSFVYLALEDDVDHQTSDVSCGVDIAISGFFSSKAKLLIFHSFPVSWIKPMISLAPNNVLNLVFERPR